MEENSREGEKSEGKISAGYIIIAVATILMLCGIIIYCVILENQTADPIIAYLSSAASINSVSAGSPDKAESHDASVVSEYSGTNLVASAGNASSVGIIESGVSHPIEIININTADADLLDSLPNIGEVRAAAIIEYRNEFGDFTCIEDLMNVSGIGEKIFEKIRDYITV